LLRLDLLATPIAFALACDGDDPQPAPDPNLTGPCQGLKQRCGKVSAEVPYKADKLVP